MALSRDVTFINRLVIQDRLDKTLLTLKEVLPMHDIICPHCNKAFKVDESGYADILKQVHDHSNSNGSCKSV